MDEPVIGLVVKPAAQRQRALQPGGEEILVDDGAGIAVEEARGHQRVRIEGRGAEALAVGGHRA